VQNGLEAGGQVAKEIGQIAVLQDCLGDVKKRLVGERVQAKSSIAGGAQASGLWGGQAGRLVLQDVGEAALEVAEK